MTTRFGWCMGPDGAHIFHDQCPGVIPGQPGLVCGCPCHESGGE